MNDINDFLANAKNNNLCERGAKVWEHCKSKKQLVDFALGGWGMEYVANAICAGWGISPESICKDFAPFNNGKYVRDKDGYTSAMYCGEETNEIFATETALLVIDFVGDIYIPENRICEIHLVNSKCYIVSKGKANVYTYGDTKIINESEASIKVIRQ